jgi:FMN-dependent NADH-azoreductase
MKRILHIDSSPRHDRSHTRNLTRELRDRLLKKYPEHELMYRDLYVGTPPHVDAPWIEAAFSKDETLSPRQKQAVEVSDHLIDEFLSADIFLLGIPMYNFGMPSVFKAYIDNIIRVNRTLSFDPNDHNEPYKPLVHGDKTMYVIIATGDDGFQKGEELFELNHLEPHLQTVFELIGIDDIKFIYCGNDEYGGEKLEKSIKQALGEIEELIEVD